MFSRESSLGTVFHWRLYNNNHYYHDEDLVITINFCLVSLLRINKEITLVGRNPSSSDIFLDSNKNKVMISRLHARIITEKDDNGKHSFKISDTSLNGTYVNDIKIADSCDIHPGDIITFGHLRGAVLSPGMFAEQQDSEFRFAVSGSKIIMQNMHVH